MGPRKSQGLFYTLAKNIHFLPGNVFKCVRDALSLCIALESSESCGTRKLIPHSLTYSRTLSLENL